MGFFKGGAQESDDTHGIRGVVSHTSQPPATVPGVDRNEVTIDFPALPLFTEDKSFYFNQDDIRRATELRTASREKVMGLALLYLASAELNIDGDQAAVAMGLMMWADRLPPAPEQS